MLVTEQKSLRFGFVYGKIGVFQFPKSLIFMKRSFSQIINLLLLLREHLDYKELKLRINKYSVLVITTVNYTTVNI